MTCQLRNIRLEKEEVTFLSANTWDVSGGGNYGYSSIWVNRNNNVFDNLDLSLKKKLKTYINCLIFFSCSALLTCVNIIVFIK